MAWSFDDGPPSKQSALEAEGTLRQARRVRDLVDDAVAAHRILALTPALVLELHTELMRDVAPESAGKYRTRDLTILGSKHVPPSFADVPALIEQLACVMNGEWSDSRVADVLAAASEVRNGKEWTDVGRLTSPAFLLWRLNWIHPFDDGNGRTARALAYALICCQAELVPPGRVTLPERILRERAKYYRCLEQADAAWKRQRVDVSHLDGFLDRLLREQLREAETE